MPPSFDQTDPKSIEAFAKRLISHVLRDFLPPDFVQAVEDVHRGSFGQVLEKGYFGLAKDAGSNPDFQEAGVELKSSPLVPSKEGSLVPKERLVLGLINYMEVHRETFEASSFKRKNAMLLLVFYLYERGKLPIDLVIKLASLWSIPPEDMKIIQDDWEKIVGKVKDGKAHEISEGDTLYLGACTKGVDSRDVVTQPYSEHKAMRRAFALKIGYVRSIVKKLLSEQEETERAVKSITEYAPQETFEDVVKKRFQPYVGMAIEEIRDAIDPELNLEAKGALATLSRRIMGVRTRKVEEFEKAELQMKTIRLEKNGIPKEHMSFPVFKLQELAKEENWEDSPTKGMLEKRFFFVVFRRDDEDNFRLKDVGFWNVSPEGLEAIRKVWEETIKRIRANDIRFPGESWNSVCHVRTHAKDGEDTDEMPDGTPITKRCFWLDRHYIAEQIKNLD